MNDKNPYDCAPNEQGSGYQISPGEAAEVRRLFEQVATKDVAIYRRVATPEQAEWQPERAAIYARSATTSREATETTGLDQQVAEGCQHCAENGYSLEEKHIYQEIAAGRRVENGPCPPQLESLRAAAKEQQFDILIVSSLDRLARNSQGRTVLLEELIEAGIRVESLDGCMLNAATWKLVQDMAQEITQDVASREQQNSINRMRHGKVAKKTQREQQR